MQSANYSVDRVLGVVKESAKYIQRQRNFNSLISERSTANLIFMDPPQPEEQVNHDNIS